MAALDIAKIAAVIAALLIGAALTYGVLRLVGEEHKQSCIAEGQARFPTTGSTKPSVSKKRAAPNASKRTAALKGCKATIF